MQIRNVFTLVALAVFLVVLTACGAAPTATPTAKPTVAATPTTAPTLPPPPTATLVPPSPTPIPPTATPVPPKATTKQEVNLRQGPGTSFTVAGKMPNNTSAIILGKNEDGKWLQIAFPDAAHPAWIATSFITVTGSTDKLPVISVPVAATATPGGPTPTKVVVATPTQSFPPAKGTLGFVSFSNAQNSYSLNNLIINPRNYSGAYLLGPNPADLRLSTNMTPFAWAPDGSRLAFVYGPNGLTDVLRVTDSAGTPKDLVSHGSSTAAGGISSPTWSPDSRSIAYIGMDNNFGTQFIYTIPPEGGAEQRFFAARGGESFRGLTWGKTWILFVSNLTGTHEIWRLNSDGSGPLQLTNDKRENGSPAWSPDGKLFAYYSKQVDGSYQIMIANADGTSTKKLTNAGNNWSPSWSPDGNHIAFTSTRGGGLAIWVMDKNGGNSQMLTDKFGAEAQLAGSWR